MDDDDLAEVQRRIAKQQIHVHAPRISSNRQGLALPSRFAGQLYRPHGVNHGIVGYGECDGPEGAESAVDFAIDSRCKERGNIRQQHQACLSAGVRKDIERDLHLLEETVWLRRHGAATRFARCESAIPYTVDDSTDCLRGQWGRVIKHEDALYSTIQKVSSMRMVIHQ